MTHGTILDFLWPTLRSTVYPAVLLFSFHFFLDLSAEESGGQDKALMAGKEERLKERDRHAQQMEGLRKEGKILEAIEACGKMLAIERDVLGDFHDDVVGSLEQLARMHEALGDFQAAEKDLREVLTIREKLHGKGDWRTTDARLDLEAVARRSELNPKERSELKEAERLNERVFDLVQGGRTREALPLAERAVEIRGRLLGRESREFAHSLVNLGFVQAATGDVRQAEEAYRRALEIRKRALGEEHPDYAVSLNNIASLYQNMGDFSRAEPLHRRALEIRKKVLGEDHPDYALSLNNLAELYRRMRDYARAEPLYRGSLEITKKTLGEDHPDYATSLNNLAALYYALGDYVRAEPLFRQTLEIRRKALGEEHPDSATSLHNLAVVYKAIGDYARAEPLYRSSMEITKKTLGEDHPDYATSVNNLAMVYKAMGHYARAEPLLRQAVEVQKKALGEDHPRYAASINNLAMLYQTMEDYGRAEPLHRQASEIWKKALGEDHPDYARSLNNLAVLYQEMGDYSRAEPLHRQASEISKKALGEDHPDYAMSINNLAELYKHVGDYARAESLHRRALEGKKRALGENHPDHARSLNNLASLYQDMGQFSRGEPLLRQASEIWKKALGEDHPDYATSLNNLGMLYQDMGDGARAEPLHLRALEIRRKALGEERPQYARSLNNLAEIYKQMGDCSRAEPLLRQASEIWKKALGEDHPDYAVALNNLASLYQDAGDYSRAEPLYRLASEIRKRALGEGHPGYAASLNNLATLYQDMGDCPRAEPLLSQAAEIWRKSLGEDHLHYATSITNLAVLYQAMGEGARALPLLRQALGVSRRHLQLASSVQSERQQLAMVGSLRERLDVYLSMAFLAGLSGTELYEEALLWKGAVHSRQRRQRLERSRPELRSLFVELESVSSSLAALALSAPEPKKRPAWKRQIDELTERKERLEGELSSKCAEYAREKALGRISPAEIQALLPQGAALVDLLEYSRSGGREDGDGRRGSRSDGETRAGAAARGESEAQAEPEAAPEKARRSPRRKERHLAAFVVLRDAPVVQLDLGPLAPIEETIVAWRGAIASDPGSASEAEAATKLRQSVWDPLQEHLAGRRLVLVSPDGALGRFPLGALPGSKPGTYLIEEVSIALLPVPQMLPDLLAGARNRDAAPSLLLVGDVDFDAGSPGAVAGPAGADLVATLGKEDPPSGERPILRDEVRTAPRGGGLSRFEPLDFTRAEILKVGEAFKAAHEDGKLSRLGGRDATETAVREAAARHEFLHLATHGFFAPEELRSALSPPRAEGADSRRPGGPAANVVGWHPGLLSGIVLAGGNKEPDPERDDGILTALELATLDLGRTELMVLSACETGLGATAGGEGLLGLQRAAQVAGAKTVVATLWSVDDRDALALMTAFYTNLWARRMPKLEALRDAQLRFLRGEPGELDSGSSLAARGTGGIAPRPDAKSPRASPRAWAAWVLSGDWR